MAYILGIKVDKIKKNDVLSRIDGWLKSDKFHYITTVNPEFILEAQKNEEFKNILNNSDLSIADGIGLKFASWLFGENINRIAGSDLAKDILNLAEQKKYSLYFFIWKKGLSRAEDVIEKIKKMHPLIRIEGQAIERDGSDIDWHRFDNFKPDILLAGLGAPYQEKLIVGEKIKKLPLKLAIGVGGTFDFLTGKIKRAPSIMRFLGLEWLFRLIKQPNRAKRIFNATAVFPWRVLKWKVRMMTKYREGVIIAVINKYNEILLCERADEENHWQFPQGGQEKNEDILSAVKRELCEETGIKNIEIIKIIDTVYKYKFDQERHIKKLVKSKYGYKGQKMYICIVKFLGEGSEIKLDYRELKNYKWVSQDKLLENLHPVRSKSGEIILAELNKL